MSLLNTLQGPLNTISNVYSQIMQLSISFRRLTQILCEEELDPTGQFLPPKSRGTYISIRNATFQTHQQEDDMIPPKTILDNLNFDVPAGKLTLVVGSTGSGKSSLLNVLMGNSLQRSRGYVYCGQDAKKSYMPQKSWLFNGTIRENILFFSPFESSFYRKVVSACALKQDFNTMKGKDMAELNDGGNLSGGQQQRISLARAVYARDAGIYLLDDPLSAVDARVSTHIFDHVFGKDGLLGLKTRVITTNRLDLLPKADHVIFMENGTVLMQGTFKELLQSGDSKVISFISSQTSQKPQLASFKEEEEVEEGFDFGYYPLDSIIEENFTTVNRKRLSTPVQGSIGRLGARGSGTLKKSVSGPMGTIGRGGSLLRKGGVVLNANGTLGRSTGTLGRSGAPVYGTLSQSKSSNELRSIAFDVEDEVEEYDDVANMKESKLHRVIKDEVPENSKVSNSLYWYYIKKCSPVLVVAVIILLLGNLGLEAWNELWLQQWGTSNTGSDLSKNFFFLGIFAAASIGATFGSIILDLVAIRFLALNASKKLHEQALIATIAAPITFFHANPAGRIINRFSNDILGLDRTIPNNLLALINSLLAATLSLILACLASYYVVIIAAILIFLYYILISFFMKSVRELRRLVLTSQSPTFQYLKESLDGIDSIRGFGRELEASVKMEGLIDTNSKVFYSTFAASSWLSTHIQFLSLLFTIPVLVFIVLSDTSTNAGLMAIALTNALNIGSTLQGIIQSYISMEISLVSIERIKEYVERESESASRISKGIVNVKANWPSRGRIDFINYSTTYNTESDDQDVLKNINLTFEAGQRIGICGRTGAGKSSLLLGLFQLLQARKGVIVLDGVDLATVNLQTLRDRLAIIPQAAMVYPGTIRENLDPAEIYSDEALWDSLEKVGMADMVYYWANPSSTKEIKSAQVKIQLKSPLDERFQGEKLSTGQKQLFCLCRAILKRSKIVVLDEPTANIDMETDERIQQVIKTCFQGSTIITIAHRIPTIMDCDKILVLDKGECVEYDTPRVLLLNKKSSFYALANGLK